jgi:hypothetical protein
VDILGDHAVRSPYCIAVWQGSIKDAVAFVDRHMLGDNVIQFVPDPEMKFAFWVALRVTGDQKAAIKEAGSRTTPKYTVIG